MSDKHKEVDSGGQLPPEYFTPLGSFDAVRHMLENLDETAGLSSGYLTSQTAQTHAVLDAINAQLSARVMRSYAAFVHGMAQVQQLESELILAAILCRSARRHLCRVQNDMAAGGLQLLTRLRRRCVVHRLVAVVHTIRDLGFSILVLQAQLDTTGISSSPGAAKCLHRCEVPYIASC